MPLRAATQLQWESPEIPWPKTKKAEVHIDMKNMPSLWLYSLC